MEFKYYLKEDLIPFSGFNIARSSMPQIHSTDKFVSYLEKQGIEIVKGKEIPSKFKPLQKDFDQEKVNKIASELSKASKPILVSNDLFVIDGHHRFFAHSDTNTPINYIMVKIPVTQLLKLAIQYT